MVIRGALLVVPNKNHTVTSPPQQHLFFHLQKGSFAASIINGEDCQSPYGSARSVENTIIFCQCVRPAAFLLQSLDSRCSTSLSASYFVAFVGDHERRTYRTRSPLEKNRHHSCTRLLSDSPCAAEERARGLTINDRR